MGIAPSSNQHVYSRDRNSCSVPMSGVDTRSRVPTRMVNSSALQAASFDPNSLHIYHKNLLSSKK
eukprot:jgi/Psemu1/38119/gm1.38119_g